MPRRKQKDTPVIKAWQTRLERVVDETQELLNDGYKIGLYKERFRFPREDRVICLCQGVYQEATISYYYRAIPCESLHPPGTIIPIEQYLPTVIVNFTGRSFKWNEEIPENELISCHATELCHIQGMLLAHEWNTFERIRLGKTELGMSASVWFLRLEKYRELEAIWQQHTGKNMSFAEFCGRFLPPNPVPEETDTDSLLFDSVPEQRFNGN